MIAARADHRFPLMAAIPKLGIALIQNEPYLRVSVAEPLDLDDEDEIAGG
jgi:hypothetical protein